MFLPPATAWMTEQHSTYSEMRTLLTQQATKAVKQSSASSAAGATAAYMNIAMPAACSLGYTGASAGASDPRSGSSNVPHSQNSPLSMMHTSAAESQAHKSMQIISNVNSMTCADGEIYCWMACQPLAPYNLTCPMSQVTCVDNAGNPADPDLMDPQDHPGCVGTAYVDPGGFCQGNFFLFKKQEPFFSRLICVFCTKFFIMILIIFPQEVE